MPSINPAPLAYLIGDPAVRGVAGRVFSVLPWGLRVVLIIVNHYSKMSFSYIFSRLDVQQIASAFIVLFAVIDVLGSTPVFITLKRQGALSMLGRLRSSLLACCLASFLPVMPCCDCST